MNWSSIVINFVIQIHLFVTWAFNVTTIYGCFPSYFDCICLTVSYMSLLSFHCLPFFNIYEASTTFISGKLMKEYARMVPSSTKVNILLLVNPSTTIIDSSFVRWPIPNVSSKTLFSRWYADEGSVYIMTKKIWAGRHADMKYWEYQNNLLFPYPS